MRVGGRPREGEYEFHRGPVLRMLAKRFPRLDEDDRLALYHDAWGRVLEKRRAGEEIVSLRAYLMASTACEALHLVSRGGRTPLPVCPDDPRLLQLADRGPSPDEQVVTRDQARIARDVLDSLDERQRQVLKLRWDLQLSGAEVRAALGLSGRQYRRLVEEGASAVSERVEQLRSGEWSSRTRSLLVACVVEVDGGDEPRRGIASRRQRERARRLVESDPHAAALLAELRRTLGRAAALAPLPALVAPPASPLELVGELFAHLRGALASGVDAAKQQTTAVYLRATDPTVLSANPRPGAAVAAVAGALAVGGGAFGTYEAVKPDETSEPRSPAVTVTAPAEPTGRSLPSDQEPAESAQPTPSSPTAKPSREPQPAPPNPQASPEFTPEATPAPTPPTPRPQPAQPNPSTPTEFGFEQ